MLVPVQKHRETLTVLSKVQISLINVHGFWMFFLQRCFEWHTHFSNHQRLMQSKTVYLALPSKGNTSKLPFPPQTLDWLRLHILEMPAKWLYIHFHNLSAIFIYYIFHGLTAASLSPAGLFPNPRGRPGRWRWKADECLGFLYSSVPSRQENPSPPASSELWSTWGPIVWTR